MNKLHRTKQQRRGRKRLAGALAAAIATLPLCLAPGAAFGAESVECPPESRALHGQATSVTQWHPTFHAPYSGPNSLDAAGRTEETTDATLTLGLHPWADAELWLMPEVDQGFGLSNTLGLAGFASGEAYKIGANTPYLRLPRAFLRQTLALGGAAGCVEGAAGAMAGPRSADNLTLTIGKFSVTDIFDTNTYAHDPRADFFNWAVIDAGAFDYAADAWGFTYGAALEWTQGNWTLRGGLFQLSKVPNGKVVAVDFSQKMAVAELERRYSWRERAGKLKLLGFSNHGRMGSYQDALQFGLQIGRPSDTAPVRKKQARSGFSVNVEQELASELGGFARFSVNDGDKEAYEFTEINRSASAGLSLKGVRWGRAEDTAGVAGVVNALSGPAQRYFAAGGLGILIGDGRLAYAPEKIGELYYALHLGRALVATLDNQRVVNPAYNHERGPVSIYGVRLHAEF